MNDDFNDLNDAAEVVVELTFKPDLTFAEQVAAQLETLVLE